MSASAVLRCRALLADVTPLTGDCGKYCGAACCASLPGEETGMLLFPGEEALYEGLSGFTVKDTPQGKLLICSGSCRREERPLACRLFPLLPLIREDGVKVAVDARSRAVCPLWGMGLRGLREDFRAAVRQCGDILYEDEVQRTFLAALTREHDELRRLQRLY